MTWMGVPEPDAAQAVSRHDQQPLYIVGAGGVGREALDVATSMQLRVAGFLDEFKAGLAVRGIPVHLPRDVSGGRYLVAIADAGVRIRLADFLGSRRMLAATLRHPFSAVGADVQIGTNCLINSHVTISCGVHISDHCQIHYNASVGHDTSLHSGVTVLPGANVAGNVRVGRGAMIGSGAVILQNLAVGSGARVGAGAVVTRDVAPMTVVVGSPARPI